MDTLCIPQGKGVPYSSQPPGFATTSGSDLPALDTKLDDPRWTGATRISYGAFGINTSGAAENASFRATYHPFQKPALYLVWRMAIDALDSLTNDQVFVGFKESGGKETILRIRPYTQDAVGKSFDFDPVTAPFEEYRKYEEPESESTDPQGPTIEYWENGAGRGEPSETHWARISVRSWKVFQRGWAVALRVPIDAAGGDAGLNLDLANGFKFWFEVRNSPIGIAGTLEHWSFPRTAASVNEFSPTPVFPPSTDWADAEHNQTCVSPGLSLASTEIGTFDDADPNTLTNVIKIKYTGTVADDAQPVNHFIARVDWDGSDAAADGSLPPTAVSADFYIANWGSQADLPLRTNSLTTSGSWAYLTSGNSTLTSAGQKVRVVGDWTPESAEAQLFMPFNLPGAKRGPHQCIYVQLSGGNLRFVNDSVANNMNFAPASLLERDAEISVRGIGPSPDGSSHRNVYLYVQTLNMPGKVQIIPEPMAKVQALRKLLWQRRGAVDDSSGSASAASSGSSLPITDPVDLLERYLPTYRVHVYHELDEQVVTGAGLCRTLRPQTSFGFFINHDGQLKGWDHQIVGADLIYPTTRTEDYTGPLIYKMRIPNEGASHITTRILARETDDDVLDHSNDAKTDCQRAVEPVLEQLQELRKQLARCCPSVIRVQAEHYLATGGVNKGPRPSSGVVAMRGFIGHISDGDWAVYGNLDFGSAGWKTVTLSYISVFGGRHVEVYADAADGLADYRGASGHKLPDRFANATKLADVELPSSGRTWNPPFVTVTAPLAAAPKDKSLIVLVFRKGQHPDPLEVAFIDWLEFQS